MHVPRRPVYDALHIFPEKLQRKRLVRPDIVVKDQGNIERREAGHSPPDQDRKKILLQYLHCFLFHVYFRIKRKSG